MVALLHWFRRGGFSKWEGRACLPDIFKALCCRRIWPPKCVARDEYSLVDNSHESKVGCPTIINLSNASMPRPRQNRPRAHFSIPQFSKETSKHDLCLRTKGSNRNNSCHHRTTTSQATSRISPAMKCGKWPFSILPQRNPHRDDSNF